MHWIIEENVFPNQRLLLDALKRNGVSHELLSSKAPARQAAVFYGSMGEGREFAQRNPAVQPGFIAGEVGYVKTHEQYSPLMLSQQFALVTVTWLCLHAKDSSLRAHYGDTVFVRPDSPFKEFSGRTISLDTVTPAALDCGFYYDDPDLPIIIARPLQIDCEWRFVIVDGEVVTSCSYDPIQRCGGSIPAPIAAQALAEYVAVGSWQPAAAYTVDVGLTNNRFGIIEFGPFSGSSFYTCDYNKIVLALK